ncbi:ABC transporter ATP-binding protein [Caminibacter pacificus]|uniref:ATP-binding cassette subfamily B protein n=2 Tax=Caminibacter pacificus TaxID=1424653 RepID=A0AAJ4RBI3_9BACT|nr:ABC transporter ATP-binding protein [Caminibacter pacificus]ROR39158.1 ATP-binding cassette subfamily B protein [Caminibacter pacificus]
MKNFFNKLFSLLSKRDKQYLLFLMLLSIVLSFIETIGVGIIMPFISIATDFNKIFTNQYIYYFYNLFDFKSSLYFVVFFGVVLIFFYIFRAIFTLFYFYMLSRFAQSRYHIIAYRLFENYIGLEYKKFIDMNSSLMTKNIITEANNLVELITKLLFLLSESFVLIFIYSMLLYVNWKMTILLTILLGMNVLFLKLFVSKKIKKAGIDREAFQSRFYKIISSAFGNFKIIKLKSKDEVILNEFENASINFVKANIKAQTLFHFPRVFLEMIGFSLIAFIVIYLVLKYHTDIKAALPILMVFVLGLYRLLPSVNRIFGAYNEILFKLQALNIIHNELIYEKENLGDEKIDFKEKIELKNVNFAYNPKKSVLKNINLTIKKGEKLGIIGESGSGKSTLIDIISGLYKPVSGEVLIDEELLNDKNVKSWRKKIGYIPQNIYLIDGTVAENVAFLEEIDEDRVKEALKKANILDFLEKHHEGIYTKIGENGIKLSGGQRQRLAIARALYHNPEVLILDEATSALDSETEKKIMEEIYKIGENKTMIIIAHRISTLDKCDRIVEIKNGEINN